MTDYDKVFRRVLRKVLCEVLWPPRATRFALVSILATSALGPASAAATTVRLADQVLKWDVMGVDIPASSHFGASVALAHAGDGMLIAAPDGGARAAYVYDSDFGWDWVDPGSTFGNTPQFYVLTADFPGILHSRLQDNGTTSIRQYLPGTSPPPPLVTGITGFVTALAKFGNAFAVGEATYSGNAGRVQIYEYIAGTWALVGSFVGAAGDELGSSLAMKSGMLVVGAPGNGPGGAVHVLVDAGSWVELQEIPCPGAQAGAEFGAAVAIEGNLLAVGAPRLDRLVAGGANVVDVGGVFTYRPAGLLFEIERLLRPSESLAGDRFGSSVAVHALGGDGFALAAGAPREEAPTTNAGAAYLFLDWGGGWSAFRRLIGATQEVGQQLGTSIALGSMGVLSGAPYRDANGFVDQGSVLAFNEVLPLFADGFDIGSTANWSSAVP